MRTNRFISSDNVECLGSTVIVILNSKGTDPNAGNSCQLHACRYAKNKSRMESL